MHIKVNLPMLKRIFPADIGAGNAPSENRIYDREKQKSARPDTQPPVADGWAGAERRVLKLRKLWKRH